MKHTLWRALLITVGSILIIAGGFAAVAGAMSGFGDHRMLVKIGYAVGGVVAACAGIYCYYVGSDRNISNMFDDVITAFIRNA